MLTIMNSAMTRRASARAKLAIRIKADLWELEKNLKPLKNFFFFFGGGELTKAYQLNKKSFFVFFLFFFWSAT